MKTALIHVVAAALLAGLSGPASVGQESKDDKKEAQVKEENLLVNGSFEEGPQTDENLGFKPLDEGALDIKGWTVTRAQIDYVDAYWKAADGKRSLDLNGSPGIGGIQQKFKTEKGKKYRVTFSLAGNPDGSGPEKKLGVKAAGKEEKFTFDTTGKSRTDMGWSTQVWEFTADDKETTLEFYSLTTDDGNYGPALDNVSVVQVMDQ
jgi:choice-of-anchor C domain-containing protein